MPERDFEPQRMIWFAPLTIRSAIGAVLVTRHVGLLIFERPARFDLFGAGPSIIDTGFLIAIAMLVFASIASSGVAKPRRRYRVVVTRVA